MTNQDEVREVKKWIQNARYLVKRLKEQNWEDAERHFADFTKSALEATTDTLLAKKRELIEAERKEGVTIHQSDFNEGINVALSILS